VINADGANAQKITYTDAEKEARGWSTEVNKIVFTRTDLLTGETGVYAIRVNETAEGPPSRLKWAPGSRFLAPGHVSSRVPMALYIGQAPGIGVDAAMRVRAEVDEHPLDRLND